MCLPLTREVGRGLYFQDGTIDLTRQSYFSPKFTFELLFAVTGRPWCIWLALRVRLC